MENKEHEVSVEAIASGFHPEDGGSSPPPRKSDRHKGKWAICGFCEKEFASYKNNGKWSKFCSVQCVRNFNSKSVPESVRVQKKKESRHRFEEKRIRSVCQKCGTGVKGANVTLCRNCHYQKMIDLTNSRTIDDMMRKSGYQKHAYQNVRNHAQRSADKYGMIKVCKVCGYDKHAELCHIQSISSFPKDTTLGCVNRRENLVYLCPTHHWELDNGILTLTG